MKSNSVFVVWMPYGVQLVNYAIGAQDPTVYDNFSQENCTHDFLSPIEGDNEEWFLGEMFTVCDAGSDAPGMARIYQVRIK